MNEYGKFVTFRVRPGRAAELIAILSQSARLASMAKGYRLFVVSEDNHETDCIRVFNVWRSRADHDQFQGGEQQRELVGKVIPLLADEPERVELSIVEGLSAE